MDLSTQTHLATLRDLLSYRLNELRAEVRADHAAHVPTAGATHEVADRKDEAAEHQLAALLQAQEERDLDELSLVEAALHRLDQGRYGDCEACGEPIGLQRLLAQPAAQRCAGCQTEVERRQAHPR